MAGKGKPNLTPRIENRKAWHEYAIDARLECGIVLQGSEVKSLRLGKATMQEAFARIEGGQMTLHGLHIDPYDKAPITNHEPKRDRRLLAHRREIKKIEGAIRERGATLIPLAIYFKGAHAKVEIGVAKGKQHHDKRATIKKKEMEKELRRVTMSHRR